MRHVIRVIAALGLGLATTLVVAWTFAVVVDAAKGNSVRAERLRSRLHGEGRGYVAVTRYTSAGSVRFESFVGSVTPGGVGDSPEPEAVATGWARSAAIPWTNGLARWPGHASHDTRLIEARGWPMLGFRCELHLVYGTDPQAYRPTGGVVLPELFDFLVPAERGDAIFLPFRPIATGLAVNTLTYGAAWWLLLIAPGLVRRFVRRRRGRCLKCGYDLLGDLRAGCPECGWLRETVQPTTGSDAAAQTPSPSA